MMTIADQLRMEGKVEGKIEGMIEGKIEGMIEGKIEGMIEGKIEGKIETFKELMISGFLSKEFAEKNIAELVKELDKIKSKE